MCETSLNDQTVLPRKLIENYKFVSCNNPSGNKHGGVGIFFKDSLPLEIRRDLSFDECLVAEIRLNRKKIFFSVIYRSPSNKADSLEFDIFLSSFETMCNSIKDENP